MLPSCYELLFWAVSLFVLYKLLEYLLSLLRVGNLSSRHILVTGCDVGFGHDCAKRLDGLGCNVFAACLTEKATEDLSKACSARVQPFVMNVADRASVKAGFQFVQGKLPPGRGLWGVVNNAGIGGQIGPVEWLTMDNFQSVFDVNLLGLIDVTLTFLPLIKREKGRIVNVASLLGRFTLAGLAPYTVTKYGVESFSDSIRRQLRPFGVSVSIIEPGFFKTNIADVEKARGTLCRSWEQASPEIQAEYGEQFKEEYIHNIVTAGPLATASANLNLVVEAYEAALLSWSPKARYLVGPDARFIFVPLQALPEWLGDALYRVLDKGPVPAACK